MYKFIQSLTPVRSRIGLWHIGIHNKVIIRLRCSETFVFLYRVSTLLSHIDESPIRRIVNIFSETIIKIGCKFVLKMSEKWSWMVKNSQDEISSVVLKTPRSIDSRNIIEFRDKNSRKIENIVKNLKFLSIREIRKEAEFFFRSESGVQLLRRVENYSRNHSKFSLDCKQNRKDCLSAS